VPVATEVFDGVLGDRPNQVERQRGDVSVSADELLDLRVEGGVVTEAGLRQNVSVGIRYVESWLRGVGAAAIDNLMEDAATAEISRSQVWQWVHAREFTADRVREVIGEETPEGGRFAEAREIFERVALGDDFVDFLTLPAYEYID
jgi:malate synthase